MFKFKFYFFREKRLRTAGLNAFFITYFSLQVGHLVHFSLEHWSSVIQYRHSVGIKSIFTDLEGTRVAFIDDHNNGFVYMPVSFSSISTNFKLLLIFSNFPPIPSALKKQFQSQTCQIKPPEFYGITRTPQSLLFLTRKFAALTFSFGNRLMEGMCEKSAKQNC